MSVEKKIMIDLPQISKSIEIDEGYTCLEIFNEYLHELPDSPKGLPMLALINNTPTQLNAPIQKPAVVRYVGYETVNGRRTYNASLAMVLYKAAEDLRFPKIIVEHALSNGFYGIIGDRTTPPTIDMLQQLSKRMQEIIDADLPIKSKYVKTCDAIAFFETEGRRTTAELLEERGRHFTRIQEIAGYKDFALEPLLPSTGMLWGFALEPIQQGFLLRVPDHHQPSLLYPMIRQPKQFGALNEHLTLMSLIGIEDIAPLNRAIRTGQGDSIIKISEAYQEKTIASIAQDIAERHEQGVKVVLLSGPSSSGKTTTTKRLATQLITNLLWPYPISLDDYYINRINTPLDEFGNYDYESLYALDLEQLQQDISRLINGEEVHIPTYNFVTGEREYIDGKQMKLDRRGVLIMEGIHALNPALLTGIHEDSIYRIYVSAMTPLSFDAHNWISTSDNRLLRRLVRDIKYRGTPADETIIRWSEVRRGEEKWIFPFQENADVMFNSAMLYEIPVLKSQALSALAQVQEVSEAYPTACRLRRLLDFFEPLDLECTPGNSLLREFLGGSTFQY